MKASEIVLHVESLTVSYDTRGGRIFALRDVGFSVGRGETLAIVGESGSGKSTVALATLGLLDNEATIHSGTIQFQGRDLRALSAAQRRTLRGDRISIVFQDPFTSLNPSLPIGLQVAEPLIHHRAMSRQAAEEKALHALAEVGLPAPADLARAYPHQLSGGMQQRVLIAASLICDPDLIILDEPTTALDVTVEAQILDLLDELRRRRGLSMLFISHNLGVVNRICDSVCVLYAGQVLERGRTADVLGQPSHPYTQGLLASVPRLRAADRRTRLQPIPGQFPELARLPEGCVFHPRCSHAEEACRTPQTLDAHGVRCWKASTITAAAAHRPEPIETKVVPAQDTLVEIRDLKKIYALGATLAGTGLEFRRIGGVLPWPRLRRPTIHAVDGVSLTIRRREILGLVGESGCGKSTLGRCTIRLIEPSSGGVRFEDRDILSASRKSLQPFRGEAQIVFQNPISSLNPRKTVGAAITRGLTLFSGLPGTARDTRLQELLHKVGLPASYADRFPHQLSGGERQRVGIARALATGPKFIVCDEPVSALDVSVQATILNLLRDLRDEFGLSYLFISHDLSVVAHIADRIAVMYAGVLCEEGPTDALLKPPYHPYTEALLSAVPSPQPNAVRRERVRLRESFSAAQRPRTGCRFHQRCPRKLGKICEENAPPKIAAGPGHTIACHIPLHELQSIPSVLDAN